MRALAWREWPTTHLEDLVDVRAHVVVRNYVFQIHQQLIALRQRLPQRVSAVVAPLVPRTGCERRARSVKGTPTTCACER